MPISDQVNGDWQAKRRGRYTGYSADVTGTTAGAVATYGNTGVNAAASGVQPAFGSVAAGVINADLKPGACLQLCAGSTLGSQVRANPAAGTLTSSTIDPNDGESLGQPIAGMSTPFVFVTEDWAKFNQDEVNALEGVTANLRTGGVVPLVAGSQTAKVLVLGTVYAGLTLLEPVSGQFYLQPVSRTGLVYQNTVAGAHAVNSTTEVAFDKKYTIPANSINVGDVFKIRYQVTTPTTVSTDAMLIKLYIGGLSGTALITTTSTDVADNNMISGEALVVIRTIGASGTFVANTTFSKVPAASGTATETFLGDLTSTAINTLTTNDITVGVTFNTNGGTIALLPILSVEKLSPSSMGMGPVAVAMETPATQPSSTAALVKVKLLTPPM